MENKTKKYIYFLIILILVVSLGVLMIVYIPDNLSPLILPIVFLIITIIYYFNLKKIPKTDPSYKNQKRITIIHIIFTIFLILNTIVKYLYFI